MTSAVLPALDRPTWIFCPPIMIALRMETGNSFAPPAATATSRSTPAAYHHRRRPPARRPRHTIERSPGPLTCALIWPNSGRHRKCRTPGAVGRRCAAAPLDLERHDSATLHGDHGGPRPIRRGTILDTLHDLLAARDGDENRADSLHRTRHRSRAHQDLARKLLRVFSGISRRRPVQAGHSRAACTAPGGTISAGQRPLSLVSAEGVGFEPTRMSPADSGFQDRRHRPLGEPS